MWIIESIIDHWLVSCRFTNTFNLFRIIFFGHIWFGFMQIFILFVFASALNRFFVNLISFIINWRWKFLIYSTIFIFRKWILLICFLWMMFKFTMIFILFVQVWIIEPIIDHWFVSWCHSNFLDLFRIIFFGHIKFATFIQNFLGLSFASALNRFIIYLICFIINGRWKFLTNFTIFIFRKWILFILLLGMVLIIILSKWTSLLFISLSI